MTNAEKLPAPASTQIPLMTLLTATGLEVEAALVDCEGFAVTNSATMTFLCRYHVNASLVGDGLARCHDHGTKDRWCEQEESNTKSGLRGLWSNPFLTTISIRRPIPSKQRQAT